MKRTIGFALGSIWRWMKGSNRAQLIDYLKELNIDGVEITLGTKEELYSFRLTPSQVSWLKKLDYVSIHAPFRLVRRADTPEEVIKQLNIISRLYKQVNAKNVIIHPNDLPSPKVLASYDMNFSTENLPKKRKVTIAKLASTLKKYPHMGLCLDVAHAYLWSRSETEKLVKRFSKRITEVHFSGTYRKKDHLSLQKVTKQFIKSIQPIKSLNVPIIIEEDIVMSDDLLNKNMAVVKNEVQYIRSLMQ